MKALGNSWDAFFEVETEKEYYQSLKSFLISEYRSYRIYPSMDNIYSTFKNVPIENIKVVILGQDPYHQPGQAHGMAFSVMPGVNPPPSLQNIKKEIQSDLGIQMSDSGYLMSWATQGVFMLNNLLTVREGAPKSHRDKGWEILTDAAIGRINEHSSPKVFLLWGRDARNKKALITNPNHLVLEAAHPSPRSAYNGFFGCRHFSQANSFLEANGIEPIDWQL